MAAKGPQKDGLHRFAPKMAAAAVSMKAIAPKAVAAGSLVLTNTVRAEIGRTTRGGVLRGVGKSGAKVGVRFDVKGGGTRVAGVVRATGPLHILERDMPAHVMPAPGGKTKLYRLAGAGKGGKGIAVPAISHPGSTGKHPFERGVKAGIVPAERAIAKVVTTSIARVLK